MISDSRIGLLARLWQCVDDPRDRNQRCSGRRFYAVGNWNREMQHTDSLSRSLERDCPCHFCQFETGRPSPRLCPSKQNWRSVPDESLTTPGLFASGSESMPTRHEHCSGFQIRNDSRIRDARALCIAISSMLLMAAPLVGCQCGPITKRRRLIAVASWGCGRIVAPGCPAQFTC